MTFISADVCFATGGAGSLPVDVVDVGVFVLHETVLKMRITISNKTGTINCFLFTKLLSFLNNGIKPQLLLFTLNLKVNIGVPR
jgi:hypothetical protein